MKLRSLALATVVLAALLGALYWSDHRKPEETKASADSSPAILKVNEAAITQVVIEKKDAEPLVLSRNSSSAWQITQPKLLNADQSSVSNVLSTLSNLDSDRLVDSKTSDLQQYGLAQPAVEVDLTEKDKSQKLLIGDATPTGNDVYAMLEGDPRVFTMAKYHETSIDKSTNDLRDKRLITLSPEKISRVDLTRKNQDIEFGRNKDEWQILKPKPLRANSNQVGELVSKLADAQMDVSGTDRKAATEGFAHATPVATARVTDPSGTQEIEIRKNKDTYYAKSSVVEGDYKVDSALGQAVDKGLDDFRNKSIFDFGYNEPDKIEVHTGSKATFLTKGGNDWWGPDGKKLEAGSVEDLIAKLRDLAASKFADSGFANPTVDITVASDSGKRVEKIAIAKSGSGYIAKREGDSTLYDLDSSSVDGLEKAADDIKPVATPGKTGK
ncbi:MAG TPA: DUF4340 domain-containing protein [Candidatus Sulfotelmatobacter sp.]